MQSDFEILECVRINNSFTEELVFIQLGLTGLARVLQENVAQKGDRFTKSNFFCLTINRFLH